MSSKTGMLLFLIGVAAGATITWTYVQKKYARIAQEEIDSVKEVFAKRTPEVEDAVTTPRTKEKPDITEYAAMVHTQGYTNYSNIPAKSDTKALDSNAPYVIAPEEFGELDEYDRISLYYLSDLVLVDDDDELIEDVESAVGMESLARFGEYEEDSVFVRNERLRCDYEILLDQRAYSDILAKSPYRAGG